MGLVVRQARSAWRKLVQIGQDVGVEHRKLEAVVCLASSQARLASRTLYFLPYLVTQSRLTALNDWS